eukprot:gnl/MRDRNA2_/MRDRNA2_70634_c0_seq1.p1 gnl/MRDRNA2_/MRDRNA2_70634_c0~~gnl/MRDRNA2_/MRDRNA2_70634_c0_seq1.p1  ORF type:complete len:275 (+),score=49.31 gnl/MRDRNA2_/MRDRNA2_70634_c0_seq1:3-827(+)
MELTLDKEASMVYSTGTEPPHQFIRFHNEMIYSNYVPRFIGFGCFKMAIESGGATLLVRNAAVEVSLPADIKQRFKSEGMRYRMRYADQRQNHSDIAKTILKVGNYWQVTFGVEDRNEVLKVCTKSERVCTFDENGSLDTFQNVDSYVIDPEGKDGAEQLFFTGIGVVNGRWTEGPLGHLPPEDRSFFGSWGNGDPFTAEEDMAMETALQQHSFKVCWQVGDVVLIDNLRVAHAREPFTDGPRQLGVLLGERLVRGPGGTLQNAEILAWEKSEL